MSNSSTQPSHRRYNPLSGDYVLCSPQRWNRPWQGKTEQVPIIKKPNYDKYCYLCPGNTRVNGHKNEKYKKVYIFDNDFQALADYRNKDDIDASNRSIESSDIEDSNLKQLQSKLYTTKSALGNSHVICYSPNHALTMSTLDVDDIHEIMKAWKDLYNYYVKQDGIQYLQIFENCGSAMGCSNPHPHGQAWASSFVPSNVVRELENMRSYYEKNQGCCMLCDLVQLELKGNRVIEVNNSFISIVPYWATWPYEILILSRHHRNSLNEMNEDQLFDLAKLLKNITVRYDNLFQCAFPYSMGLHQAPTSKEAYNTELAHFHIHFYPPLLRSATVKKWMVGYEMLGEPQRDITPELAAKNLKALSLIHYSLEAKL